MNSTRRQYHPTPNEGIGTHPQSIRPDSSLSVVPLLQPVRVGHDVAVEDGGRESHRHARVGRVDEGSDVRLDRCRTEQKMSPMNKILSSVREEKG